MGSCTQFRVLHYFYSFNQRKKVVAHCLNFDIIATADDVSEAERRLDALVRFHIETYLRSNGLSGLNDPAPSEFFASYTQALRNGKVLPPSTLRISVPDVVPMEKPYGDLEIVSAKAA